MFCWRKRMEGGRIRWQEVIHPESFYLGETSARTITESVVSRCVNVWTFFSTPKQYDGELCRAPWFDLNKDQKCTKWNRLRAGPSDRWRIQNSGENQTFVTVLSLLHRPLRLVLVPHFSGVFLTSCFHETSLPQLKRSGEISPDQRADFSFSTGLVWHKPLDMRCFFVLYVFILWRFGSYGIQNLTKNVFLGFFLY